MRLTLGEAATLLLIALPNLISALPVNTAMNTEVEISAPLQLRDIEKLIPITPGHSKRDDEVLVPIAITPGHYRRDIVDLEARKTIPAIDQLDAGSISPDTISDAQKRKHIPAADQSDAGSVSPDDVHNNNKRQGYYHTETVIATVMETVTGGVWIPGYPATVTTSAHTSILTHADSTTSTGIPHVSSTPTSLKPDTTTHIISNGGTSTRESGTMTSKFIPSSTGKSILPSGTGDNSAHIHPSGTGTGRRHLSGTGHVSVSKTEVAHPSGTGNLHHSGTIHASSKPSGSASKPSGSGPVTTIIGSTSTTTIYKTVDASASGKPSSIPANSASHTSIIASGPTGIKSSSSRMKAISTAVSASRSAAHSSPASTHPASITSTAHSFSRTHISSSTVKPTSKPDAKPSSKSESVVVKPTSTKAAPQPPMTSKIVYSGVQKVEPFSV